MKSKLLSIMLMIILAVAAATPAYAGESAGKDLEIRVKAGNAQMKVNGQIVKITAPYLTGSTTMIPMTVFTKGLGAKLLLKSNKLITLVQGKKTVVLTIGSKSATVNGTKQTLAAAPVVKNNVTFAPVKVLEWLGAKVKTDAASKEIVITMAAPVPAEKPGDSGIPANPGTGSTIDTDAGKSRIGDSYYQWSMNYPTGLIQDVQSEDGDSLIFRDVKKEYYVAIFVKPEANTLTTDEKRNTLYAYMNLSETVLDKRTVTAFSTNFEKITTKDKEGFFYEYRGLQANKNMYVIVFGKKVNKAAELVSFTGVLDSFTPAFDAADVKLKDLTQIKAGFKSFKNEDYGLSVTLPKEWKVNDKISYPSYFTDDAYVFLELTSVVSGDTVDAWITRKMKRFEDTFAPSYRKTLDQRDITWNGVPAKWVKLSYSYDTELWWEEYEIFALQGKYRYYIEYGYKESAKSTFEPMFDAIRPSLAVDFKAVESNFGEITDDRDMADRTKLITKTSTKYRYSIQVPQHWLADKNDFEADTVDYTYPGGNFAVIIWEDVIEAEEVYSFLDQHYQKMLTERPKMRIVENVMVPFAGNMAKKIVIEDKTNDAQTSPSYSVFYYIFKEGKIYQAGGEYLLANGSGFITGQLEAAIRSFQFTP